MRVNSNFESEVAVSEIAGFATNPFSVKPVAFSVRSITSLIFTLYSEFSMP